MEDQPDVVVVGSANVDTVLTVARLPRPGETVLAARRTTGPGGKGANQASAASRSGARTALVAALGPDSGADLLRDALRGSGVDGAHLQTGGRSTGSAVVVVDEAGENAIVVDPGANADLHLDEDALAVVAGARVVLAQLEVPLPVVVQALTAATGRRVLNAAPAGPLPPELTAVVDVLVVNESEAELLGGVEGLQRQVPEVVVTLGAAGALVSSTSGTVRVPGVPARDVVDTTGAGDVFCGALAAGLATGRSTADAARTACAAASLSVEREGAGASAPTAAEVAARLTEVSA